MVPRSPLARGTTTVSETAPRPRDRPGSAQTVSADVRAVFSFALILVGLVFRGREAEGKVRAWDGNQGSNFPSFGDRIREKEQQFVEESVMGQVVLAFLVCGLQVLPAEDKPKPKDLLVGKWEIEDIWKQTWYVMEFTSDAKVKRSIKHFHDDIRMDGTYKFLSDNEIEVTMAIYGSALLHPETRVFRAKIWVTEHRLWIKDTKGTEKYIRVK